VDTTTRRQRINKFPKNPDNFENNFLFVSGNTVLTDVIDYSANMNVLSSNNISTFDVYINNDFYGTNIQVIQITTNDVLRIQVTKVDVTKQANILFENKLI
jgi:hypothetical protein